MNKRLVGCIVFILACLVFAAPAYAESPSYVALKQLALKYNLNYERDFVTGREIFSGSGFNIIASSGMSTIIINNKLTVLDNKLTSVNGQLSVSRKDYDNLDAMFVKKPEIKESKKESEKKNWLKKVVLDPGHGGPFRGCKSPEGLLEKEVNLDVAKRLKALLEKNDIKVILTRTADRSLSANLNEDLRRRVDIANREAPDLFISIHCNWSDSSSVNGFEIYYSPENTALPSLNEQVIGEEVPEDRQTQKALVNILKSEFDKRTVEFAGEVKNKLDELPTSNRGIRKANFRVIKYTEYPSVLVEMDYLSNPEMDSKFQTESYRQEIAEKIKEAILLFGSRK